MLLSSSEDSENVNSKISKRKKILKRKKKKRQSIGCLGYGDSDKPLAECINNNTTTEETAVLENNPKRISNNTELEKNFTDKPVINSDSESFNVQSNQKDEPDGYCLVHICEDNSVKENSKNLKWEKLKPINCKIRNSKIIYQNEITVIENNSDKISSEKNKSKVDQMRRSKGERKCKDEEDSDFFLCRRSKIEIVRGEGMTCSLIYFN